MKQGHEKKIFFYILLIVARVNHSRAWLKLSQSVMIIKEQRSLAFCFPICTNAAPYEDQIVISNSWPNYCGVYHTSWLGVISKRKNSIFKDIVEIEVDPPPSHPIFDKFIFYTVLIMSTSLPPLEFLTKIMKF